MKPLQIVPLELLEALAGKCSTEQSTPAPEPSRNGHREAFDLNGFITRHNLNVDGPHWRTQSRRTLTPGSAGHWVVEVRDDAGNVLARGEFDCVAD